MTKSEIVKKIGEIDYLDDASQESLNLYREILDSGSINLLRACLRMAHFTGHRDASVAMRGKTAAMVDNSNALMELTASLFDK